MNVAVGGRQSAVGEALTSFRDLRVWQWSMEMVEQISSAMSSFPREETFGLTSQLRRAAVSIPSDIAEEHARESTRDLLHHVSVAQGSLAEVETQIELAARLGFIDETITEQLRLKAASAGRQLYALRNSLRRTLESGSSSVPRPPTTDPQ